MRGNYLIFLIVFSPPQKENVVENERNYLLFLILFSPPRKENVVENERKCLLQCLRDNLFFVTMSRQSHVICNNEQAKSYIYCKPLNFL